MKSKLTLILICLGWTVLFGQNSYSIIKGNIKHLDSDSLVFENELLISKDFYTPVQIEAFAQKDHFEIRFPKKAYPQMYTLSIPSEINTTGILQRRSDFFLDNTTQLVTIDLSDDSQNIVGKTYKEYTERFLPWFPEAGAHAFLSKVIANYGRNQQLYPKLLSYTRHYPDSYVSLWALIFAISRNTGTFQQQRAVLDAFSPQMKQGELWKLVNKDLEKVTIRRGEKFPTLDLKDPDLKPKQLAIPDQKYVLVDWWFSTCKPCLEAFVKLKPIYQNYRNKGFEIVGISTDQTVRIPLWQKRIKALGLVWPQYLDENAVQATQNHILSFPHNELLENGKVIQENLSPEEVETFLKKHL